MERCDERAEREPDLRDLREHAAERDRVEAVGPLDPPDPQAGARERGDVRPDGVHVLVDPQRLFRLLLGILRAAQDAARPLVQPRHDGARPRDARHLAHHPLEVERVVQRRDAVDDVEAPVRERQVLAVGLDARELAVERSAAEPDLRVGEDVRRHELAVALEPEARGPGLGGAQLEHAQPAPLLDVAPEQDLDRVAVREPVEVVPAELLVHEREHGVHLVVRLVPALRARLLDPAGRLAELLARARQLLVQHQRDAVVEAEGSPAACADEAVVAPRERGVAERTAQELEERRFHVWAPSQTTLRGLMLRRAQTPALQRLVTVSAVLRAARPARPGRGAL